MIRELSFAVDFGEVFAVLGPNGVGKSTLLRGVSGLLPSEGSVTIDGCDLGALSTRERARRLAFVPQTASLMSPLPVREVVAHGRYAHGLGLSRLRKDDLEAVHQALSTTDLEHLQDRPFTTLSQGEKQRVMLARALCTGARILCLDEPTAALDVGHALDLYTLARQLSDRGFAVLMVLHQLADALRFADRALLMSPDHENSLGPVEQVIAPRIVRSVYGVNMRKDAGLEFDLVAGAPR